MLPEGFIIMRMTPEPAQFPLRKKSDIKISLMVGLLGCLICLFIDWIVHGLTRSTHPIASVTLVPVLSMLNALGGFSVWRKIEGSQRLLMLWGVLASVAAMAFIPYRSGPLNGLSVLLWTIGIALCTYFAVPVQRLVIKVEREALKQTLQSPK